MKKKTYETPQVDVMVAQAETAMLYNSGLDNRNQSERGGVGANEVTFVDDEEEVSYVESVDMWSDFDK